MTQCRAFGVQILATEDRRNQISAMLYVMLKNSLSKEALVALSHDKDEYKINGEGEGLCLLKQIFSKSHVDTNATVTSYRNQVAALDHKIFDVKCDMKLFHAMVHTLEHGLLAYCERCDELLTNLFKAYKVIRDDEFLMFIRVHEFNYKQTGSSTLTAKTLMNSVENHYEKRLIENTWTPKVARADRERIVALPAYDALVATVPPPRNNNRNNNGPRNARQGNKKQDDELYKWKSVPPKPGAALAYQWPHNGKTYYWCPGHNAWTVHTPDDCTIGGGNQGIRANHAVNMIHTPLVPAQILAEPRPLTMQINPAMQAIVDNGGDMFDD